MIHLLGKVYLEYIEKKPQVNHISVKPYQYLFIADRGLAGMVDKDTEDLHIVRFKNLEECIEKFTTFDNFMAFLLDKTVEDRVILHCDEVSLPKMLCSLWKSLFPNITAELAYSLYVTYKDSEHFKREHGSEYIDIEVNSAKIAKSAFLGRYWDLSKEAFKTIFSDAQAFTLTGKEDLIGLEYVFTKLILDEQKYESVFESKLVSLYKKNLVKEILFMAAMIKEHAMILLQEKSILDAISLNDLSVIDYLRSEEKYAVLFDQKLEFSADTYEHLRSSYTIFKLISDLFADCSIIHKKINPAHVSIEELKQEHPIVSYILENKKEPSVKELLDSDIFQYSNYHFLRNYINMGIFNHYLVQSVLVTHQANPAALDALK